MLDRAKDKRGVRKGVAGMRKGVAKSAVRTKASHHKKVPADSSEGSDDEHLAIGPTTNRVAICEIVEVISRDLSPPQSDLSPHWSGSEAGSDVSAIAEEIVDKVMNTQREQPNDSGRLELETEKTTVEVVERRKETEKAGEEKTVRFSLDATPTGQPRETGETGGRTETISQLPEKLQSVQEDGSKVILCSNGTRKIVSGDGKSVTLEFQNGDTKYIGPDNTVVCTVC